ncbi:proteasome subunit alpha type-1 [Drosophila ficusphila]|uniref:proteasome subunit alpha type-1 n=1 Tax=Drosophila ficusphila TaxID=30025 RepID=UPI0007E6F238|nr:proteasome subunit alpha type-1 [Drosophila ficusphila]
MFRNQYDSDTTVWSPQGRLFQVEYAMEAVKQGAATVGLKSSDYAVLIALCRSSKDTNTLQRKIMPVDSHVGMSIAGLTADARQVCQYIRTECMSYRHSYDSEYPIRRLVANLGNKLQATTQRYDRRPYGVGMLVAGYDEQGPHIYQVMPTANVLNCKAMAIGSRSQSARTYLERHMESFESSSKDELICHGIQAIRGALGHEDSSTLTINVAIVGKDVPFTTFTDNQNRVYLNMAKVQGDPLSGEEDIFSDEGMSDDDLMDQGPSGSGMPAEDAADVNSSPSTGGI